MENPHFLHRDLGDVRFPRVSPTAHFSDDELHSAANAGARDYTPGPRSFGCPGGWERLGKARLGSMESIEG